MKHSPRSGGFSFGLLLLAAGCILCWATGLQAETVRGRLIPELRLKNGTVLHAVTVVAVGSTSLTARWDGGQGSLPFKLLPDALRTELAPVVAAKPAAEAPVELPSELDPNLATAELPTEIKLTNGFIMHKSTVTRWEMNSVLINYQGGIVSVRFKNISPDQRGIFEARKDEALARQAKDDSSIATGEDNASREEQAKQASADQAKAAVEQKAEEIRNGISFHYLVKGMSKDQVKEAYGRPFADYGEILLYPSRGHGKFGNSADRQLAFQNGVLIGWKDMRDGEPAGAVEH